MPVTVSVRHDPVSDDVKSYVEDRLRDIVGSHGKIISVKAILDSQKHRQKAEIIIHGKHMNLESDFECFDMREAVEKALEKIDVQLAKHFDRVHNHHKSLKGEAPKMPEVEDADEMV